MIPCVLNVVDLKPFPDPSAGLRRRHVARRGHLPALRPPARNHPPGSVAARILANSATGAEEPDVSRRRLSAGRRDFILLSSLAAGAACFLSVAAARAEERAPDSPDSGGALAEEEKKEEEEEEKKEREAEAAYRVYDATAIGEPQAVGKDKGKVWEKLLGARVVYLGEAEQVPDRDDRVLELEIVRKLRNRCFEQQRPISVALEAFPSNLQEQLNLFMQKRIDGEGLKSYTSHWPPQLWLEYEPLLNYCRDNGVRLVACGTPLEVLRTVRAEGIQGLSKAQRKLYAPPAGSGFVSGFTSHSGRSTIDAISPNLSVPFGPSSYLSAQARVVEDYSMSQIILQAMTDGGSVGMLVVITGASHVIYGSRGIGIPARISKKLQKKNQAVILLDPERQHIRGEGEAPVADFLWYSAAKTCTRNCFDRAEIARVMNAAGRRRDALPQDLQKGLDLGLVSPEILQNFFDLEQYPLIAELIHRFQGFRERLLVDPKFLHRLAIEEAISITTTLLAQYERRKERFFEEIDYVLTDTIRGSVVDFFTVWLPAPTLSFLSYVDNDSSPGKLKLLKGLLGSIPDNAFQKATPGVDWNLSQRFASVLIGGLKLSGVGFISSIGAGAASSILYIIRRSLNPALAVNKRQRSPILKSAVVYGCFLGTSSNLRYQIIAGLVEHRLSDYLLSCYNEPFLVNALSFVVRTVNSYWATQQWVDLARFTGLQPRKNELTSGQASNMLGSSSVECSSAEANRTEEINNQSSESP
uniref:Cyclin-dependent kinase inhibitor 4 n=1 Tax=Anthurium amnicola TaxID=1678845 RepID=A0A1D1Z770_9ARAE